MNRHSACRVKAVLQNQNGFTLIEVLMAMAIFAIGILGFYSLQLSSVTMNAKAGNTTSSSTWAADKIEEIISLDYNVDLIDSDAVGSAGFGLAGLDDIASPDLGPFISPDLLYTIYCNVASGEPLQGGVAPSNDRTKTIKVLVQKNGGIGADKITSMTYYRQKPF